MLCLFDVHSFLILNLNVYQCTLRCIPRMRYPWVMYLHGYLWSEVLKYYIRYLHRKIYYIIPLGIHHWLTSKGAIVLTEISYHYATFFVFEDLMLTVFSCKFVILTSYVTRHTIENTWYMNCVMLEYSGITWNLLCLMFRQSLKCSLLISNCNSMKNSITFVASASVNLWIPMIH